MSAITIPLYFPVSAIAGLIGLILLLAKRKTLRKSNPALYKSVLIFLFTYTLLIGNALGHDFYSQWNLNKYDLNKNGLFDSPTEITPAQERAKERLINDAGRNSAFINTGIVSAILSISIFILMKANDALLGSNENKNTHTLNNIHTQ